MYMIIKNLTFVVLASLMLAYASCSPAAQEEKQSQTDTTITVSAPSAGLAAVLKVLDMKGAPANNGAYPAFVEAKALYKMLSKKPVILDVRSADAYKAGHIKGAISVLPADIPEYWAKNAETLAKADTLVIVDADGQTAAYVTALLRLNSVSNAFSLKFGMAAWNKSVAAESWEKAVSSDFESKLDTSEATKPQFSGWPLQSDSVAEVEAYFSERWKALFAEPMPFVDANDVFSNSQQYFIMNYDRKDRYQSGHIPGAVRYKPENLLGNIDEMSTLPAGKPIVVYCNTGQNASYVTAYLRLAGYDAKILNHGCNSFMHSKMMAEKTDLAWIPFTQEQVNNFPLSK